MRVFHIALYLPFNAPSHVEVPQPYWDARMFTLAVKTGTINGFCHIPVRTALSMRILPRRIDSSNVARARQYFGKWALRVLHHEVPGQDLVFIPVPSTDAVIDAAGPFRATQMVVEALAGQTAPPICDVLRFTRTVERATARGPRRADEVYPLLRVVGRVPAAPIVLIDDIVTSGGHLQAAKRRLEENGGTVIFAIACARTVYDVSANPWGTRVHDLEDDF
jgi:hypothetical protein